MARIFITGSADGLGQMAARLLVAGRHKVVLHARDAGRSKDALRGVPGAETVVTGDLSSISETIEVARQVNALGAFDAVIHNAGVGYREATRIETPDGLPHVFAVNSLAPYILTALIKPPRRLIYISSGLHREGDASLRDLEWKQRRWNGFAAYADSKLHNVVLAFAVARRAPGILSNALEPGWVATRMGGAAAPDSLEEGPETQVWLAGSNDPKALVSGSYFYHKEPRAYHPAASDEEVQDRLLAAYELLTNIPLPVFTKW